MIAQSYVGCLRPFQPCVYFSDSATAVFKCDYLTSNQATFLGNKIESEQKHIVLCIFSILFHDILLIFCDS